MHAYVFATWKVLFNKVNTLLESQDNFGCLGFTSKFQLGICSRTLQTFTTQSYYWSLCYISHSSFFVNTYTVNVLSIKWPKQLFLDPIPILEIRLLWQLIGSFHLHSYIVQILVQSNFEKISLVLALETTELVSEPVTKMAVELINNHLISVHQKRWV